jgi:L-fuconolactonase
MTVDCYAHSGLDKYLPVEALDRVMRASEVSAAVLCQHLGQFDNGYIASVVRDRPERFAGIALVDHRSPAWRDSVSVLAKQQFRGLRLTSSALSENDELGRVAASCGLVPTIYAVDDLGELIEPIRKLARANPGTPLVVSHLGNVRVIEDRVERGTEILQLAAEPNVYVALSGLHMYCDYPYAALNSLVANVLAAFGPDRIMWGSNYPVCGDTAADYARDLGLLQAGSWGIEGAALDLITDTTARRVWFE